MALVKVGADVHCKDNDGCGSSGLHPCVVGSSRFGANGQSTRGGSAGAPVWLRRWTALHRASCNGRKEAAVALVKAGADVHCKDNDGYGF